MKQLTDKTLTVSQLCDLVCEIISDKQEIARLRDEVFAGVNRVDLLRLLSEKLEDGVFIQHDPTVQFTANDVNAAASARFFKGQGMTLVMGWLLLVTITVVLPAYIAVPQIVLYLLNGVYAVVFVWIYTKELRKLRRKMWAGLGRPNER